MRKAAWFALGLLVAGMFFQLGILAVVHLLGP
jgi:hypothetical protein